MTLVARLKERLKNRLIILPLLAVLSVPSVSCSVARNFRVDVKEGIIYANNYAYIKRVIPEIKDDNTIFYCNTAPAEPFDGALWNTMFYAWFSPSPEEKLYFSKVEWEKWYSQHPKFMQSAEECRDFYTLTEESRENYLRSQNIAIPEKRKCTIQHEQKILREIFPVSNPPYRFFQCNPNPTPLKGVNKHWVAMFYAWNNNISDVSEAEWKLPFNLREDYMDAARDCNDFYNLAIKQHQEYAKR